MQIAAWRRLSGSQEGPYLSVNVSARQLNQDNFVESCLGMLSKHGLAAKDLRLELTETLLIGAFSKGAGVLEDLRRSGFEIYVDDFGTGFSSLSYITHLPIAAIKLDRCFMHDLDCNPANQATVRAVMSVAHTRRLAVIAEGLETPRELAMLTQLGCRLGQGFLFSKPLAAEEVPLWLQAEATRLKVA